MTDVLIVGGGVIGLSIAYELAGQGSKVCVLEQGEFGREASWAGAGILPPGNPELARGPTARLRAESHRQWPSLSRELFETTGIDNGFRKCGGISLTFGTETESCRKEIDFWRAEGVEVEPLTPAGLSEREPAICDETSAAYRLPDLCQVRNPRHLKALLAGCAARGVELYSGSPVVDFDCKQVKVVAVRTPTDRHSAGQFCVAAGAWTRQLLLTAGVELSIEPVRGQIVLLAVQPPPIRHVIEIGSRYLVPRSDGRILIGSTEETVGFDKSNTAAGVSGLIELATRIVPCLSAAKFERSWAGLRPETASGLPFLDRVPGMENLFVAAGHFRSGLQMSPATARLMREMILGQEPTIPLDAFTCDGRSGDRSP